MEEGSLIAIPSFIKVWFLVTSNNGKMGYAGNTEIIRKHFHDHQENLCIAVLSIIPLSKKFCINEGYFIQGALNNIQGLLWKIQGLFKDIPQFFNFQGLFKDMILFQGLFKARANHEFIKFVEK